MWAKLLKGERRSDRRYQVSLPATVIFLGTASGTEQPLAALGTTRDLSSKGLAVVAPSFPFPGDELTPAQRALRITLALTVGYVVAEAVLVWHEPLPAAHPQVGYLLAAQITDMHPSDRAMYLDYLKGLAAG